MEVIGWSSSKIVSGNHTLPPRWPPQCSCVVIESSFDPGERLQAPGSLLFSNMTKLYCPNQGRIQDFKLGGDIPKKNCVERREARKFFGISCEKSRLKKSYFFPILGGACRVRPPPGSPLQINLSITSLRLIPTFRPVFDNQC